MSFHNIVWMTNTKMRYKLGAICFHLMDENTETERISNLLTVTGLGCGKTVSQTHLFDSTTCALFTGSQLLQQPILWSILGHGIGMERIQVKL